MNYRKLIQDELAKLHTANGMKADPLLDSDLGADIVADICRNVVNKTCNIPHVIDMCCPYCKSEDIVWYGLSGDCVCNKCGGEGSIIL